MGDDQLRATSRMIRLDPDVLGRLLAMLLPDDVEGIELTMDRVQEQVKTFVGISHVSIAAIQASCAHDWESLGGHDYLEERCHKCKLSQWI